MNDDKKWILDCILCHGVKKGKFKLTSGKISDYYIDIKTVSLLPTVMESIGSEILKEVLPEKVKAIGGMEFGAIPLVLYTCMVSLRKYSDVILKPFIIRKGDRNHGTQKRIEGSFLPSRAVLIDDVATSGESIVKSITILNQEESIEVSKVIVLVDREEGAKEKVEYMGAKFSSIFTMNEILKEYKEEE